VKLSVELDIYNVKSYKHGDDVKLTGYIWQLLGVKVSSLVHKDPNLRVEGEWK
jgi:hypothetical protein